jgi:DNA-binding NarL/FixJ family response regulator
MPHPNLNQEIEISAEQLGSEGGFCLDELAGGAKEGQCSLPAGRNDFGLNPFEKQVIALSVAGYSSEEIAKRIGISQAAMRRHFTNICEKLQVSDRLELILFAIYHQLVDTNDV